MSGSRRPTYKWREDISIFFGEILWGKFFFSCLIFWENHSAILLFQADKLRIMLNRFICYVEHRDKMQNNKIEILRPFLSPCLFPFLSTFLFPFLYGFFLSVVVKYIYRSLYVQKTKSHNITWLIICLSII